jgi:hypothetical protein
MCANVASLLMSWILIQEVGVMFTDHNARPTNEPKLCRMSPYLFRSVGFGNTTVPTLNAKLGKSIGLDNAWSPRFPFLGLINSAPE